MSPMKEEYRCPTTENINVPLAASVVITVTMQTSQDAQEQKIYM